MTVLFLSDLHIDNDPAAADRLRHHLAGASCDVLLVGGDITGNSPHRWRKAASLMIEALAGVEVRQGRFAVLGNHDPVEMLSGLDGVGGWRVLLNETVHLPFGCGDISLTGTDSPEPAVSQGAAAALMVAKSGGIVLTHSPRIAPEAARAGAALMLCGHTHDGQIRMPWGWRPVTHTDAPPDRLGGWWRLDDLQGLTSPGVGTSGIPVRYFTRPTVHYLTITATGA